MEKKETRSKFRFLEASQKEAVDMAQVLSNKTAQKILEYLAQNTATETELIKALNLSASTIHYNIKQLRAVKLIVGDTMHYSPKGKEVIHYRATDEHIIISPKVSFNLAEKLQAFIPLILLLIIAFGFVNMSPLLGYTSSDMSTVEEIPMMEAKIQQVNAVTTEASSSSYEALDSTDQLPEIMQAPNSEPNGNIILLSILIGVLLAFFTLLVVYLFKKR